MTAITPSETKAIATAAGRLRGFSSGAREIDAAPVEVRGTLPPWLRGSLLLNGPALWELPQGSFRHWFDGFAMLHAVRIGDAGASYRSRFLQSADYRAAAAAGRPTLSGFGTPDPMGFWRRLLILFRPRITDNGAVVMSRLGDQWIAQTETPFIHGFDPDTLATTGPIAFADREKMHLMAAHGITEADGTYWNVGVELGPKCTYKVFRVRPGSRAREVVGRWTVKRSAYLHALALTPHHALVWEPALRAQPLKFIFGGEAYMDNFRWEPELGSRITAVARDGSGLRSWAVPPMFAFHAVQAFEDGEDLVLDLCCSSHEIFQALMLDRLRTGTPVSVPHRLVRYRLRPGREDAVPELLAADVELPMVHPAFWTRQRARYAWCASFDPDAGSVTPDRTVKLDLDGQRVAGTWQRGKATQLEPLYVERPGAVAEEDGVLLVPTLAEDDASTIVGVIDPATMECMATLQLPQVVPFGFHAAWKWG